MKATDLRKMSINELNEELRSSLKAKFGIRMQIATQQISNTNQLRAIKRDIARIKTTLSQKIG